MKGVEYPPTRPPRLDEALEIARQCREAAELVVVDYPIAARLLVAEAARWLPGDAPHTRCEAADE